MQVNTENKGVKIESNISNQYNNNNSANYNIKQPYIIAYQIRELLNLPRNNNIWLNKIEKECLNNNNYLLSSESDSNSDSDTE